MFSAVQIIQINKHTIKLANCSKHEGHEKRSHETFSIGFIKMNLSHKVPDWIKTN